VVCYMWRLLNGEGLMRDENDGVSPRPYIHDRGTLLTYMMITYLLTNSEMT
jgi:hypothetical protein